MHPQQREGGQFLFPPEKGRIDGLHDFNLGHKGLVSSDHSRKILLFGFLFPLAAFLQCAAKKRKIGASQEKLPQIDPNSQWENKNSREEQTGNLPAS